MTEKCSCYGCKEEAYVTIHLCENHLRDERIISFIHESIGLMKSLKHGRIYIPEGLPKEERK